MELTATTPVCLKRKLNMQDKVALTITLPSINGITIITEHTALTVRPGRQVSTVFTYTTVDTPAVTITLTRWQTQHTHRINE